MKVADLRRGLAVACAIAMLFPDAALLAQDAPEQQYKLVIVRGENAQNNIKKGRATRPVVEVRDRNNKPVAGALVLFTLPSTGPSGTFVGGGQIASVTTNGAGQASASFTPNAIPGQYKINVSAGSGAGAVAAEIVTVNVLTSAVVTGTTLALILGLVGAGVAGTAVALTRDSGGSGATTPAGIRIGPGTGTVTPPR
jgi:hypothetical protein